jgi:hypothetical protein
MREWCLQNLCKQTSKVTMIFLKPGCQSSVNSHITNYILKKSSTPRRKYCSSMWKWVKVEDQGSFPFPRHFPSIFSLISIKRGKFDPLHDKIQSKAHFFYITWKLPFSSFKCTVYHHVVPPPPSFFSRTHSSSLSETLTTKH